MPAFSPACLPQVLEAERAAKEALQARLEQARAAGERKASLVAQLRRQQEELQARLEAAATGDTAARLEVRAVQRSRAARPPACRQLPTAAPAPAPAPQAAEVRAKQAAAAAARKDSLVKDLKDRLEHAAQAQAAAAAAGQAAAAADTAELERCRQQLQRQRGELQRKEGAVRGLQAELEGCKRRLAELEAAAAAGEAAARRAQQAGAEGAAARKRAAQLLQALRALVQLLLHCTLSMRGAARALGAAPAAAEESSGELPGAGDIAALVDMSEEEVRDLLGGGRGGGSSRGGRSGAGGTGGEAGPLKAQAERVLAALEGAVAAGGAGRDEGGGKDQLGGRAGAWDSGALMELIEGLQGEVQAAQQALLAGGAAAA
jgi:hypothetical protein